ncbi:MAG: hypothetical protein ACTSR0_06520 [Candidatus Asgardarchaeia archaeon]
MKITLFSLFGIKELKIAKIVDEIRIIKDTSLARVIFTKLDFLKAIFQLPLISSPH